MAVQMLLLTDTNCMCIKTPLTSTWPHLRRDVGLEEGKYK